MVWCSKRLKNRTRIVSASCVAACVFVKCNRLYLDSACILQQGICDNLVELAGYAQLMQETPLGSKNFAPQLELTPVHCTSRRIRGHAPEFGNLQEKVMTATTATSTERVTPTYLTLLNPQVPTVFHGNTFEDVEDWLAEFERVAAFNEWDNNAKLRDVYFSLQDGARTWFRNRESALSSWPEFQRKLLETYSSSPDRREKAERALQSRVQKPNESITMYMEDMMRLFQRADPSMSEEKKVRHLMRGVKEQLFGGLVRNTPKTVAEFLTEATAMEKTFQQRSNLYNRQVYAACTPDAPVGLGCDAALLCELIRSVVRDELQKHHGTSPPPVSSLASVVHYEVQQVLQASLSSSEAPPLCVVTFEGEEERSAVP
ncbi:uncharacterized protein [Dermacentor andersoni]|uniref:uncharacterized protein n=1 Tax=Dermacentor andersoni TaxID=34620 RepID=UPI002415C46F|nr:uncharacterized protein LOC129384498 [Dermacentor andersoni]